MRPPSTRIRLLARTVTATALVTALLPVSAAAAGPSPQPAPATAATTTVDDDTLADDGHDPEPEREQDDWADAGTAARKSARLAAAVPGRPADFRIQSRSSLTLVNSLDAALPKQSLTLLMEQANRNNTWNAACTGNPGSLYGPVLVPQNRACWDGDANVPPSGDAGTAEWVPQAITGISDAQEDEQWGGSPSSPIAVASYDKENTGRTHFAVDKGACQLPTASSDCNEKGVRVTFLNRATGKYRHVLLVWPYVNAYDNISFDALHAREGACPPSGAIPACKAQNGIHAGGMAWYGNYLYVADTANGLRVFDLRKIMDLNPDQNAAVHDPTPDGLVSNVADTTRVGRQSNVWYGFGYRYVMPQVAMLKLTTARNTGETKDSQCYATGRPKVSYASLDRTGNDSLIIGEYCISNGQNGGTSNGRVGVYSMASIAAAVENPGAVVNADEAYGLPTGGSLSGGVLWHKVQGALRHEGKWYFHRSNKGEKGRLLQATPQAGELVGNPTALVSSTGPEDLYLTHGRGSVPHAPAELWSLSEHVSSAKCPGCKREVYSYPMSSVISAFGS